MQKRMTAAALSFLMAIGGGVALAETGGQVSSSSAAPPAQSPGQSGATAVPADKRGPVGFEEEEVETAPWTVQRVDAKKNNLVLQAPDGTQSTVNVPAGTPGFDSLKKGDQVQLDYFDAAVIEPAAPNKASGASSASTAQSAASNGSNRKVRSIRKVGPNSNGNNMGQTGSTTAPTDTGTSGSHPSGSTTR